MSHPKSASDAGALAPSTRPERVAFDGRSTTDCAPAPTGTQQGEQDGERHHHSGYFHEVVGTTSRVSTNSAGHGDFAHAARARHGSNWRSGVRRGGERSKRDAIGHEALRRRKRSAVSVSSVDSSSGSRPRRTGSHRPFVCDVSRLNGFDRSGLKTERRSEEGAHSRASFSGVSAQACTSPRAPSLTPIAFAHMATVFGSNGQSRIAVTA